MWSNGLFNILLSYPFYSSVASYLWYWMSVWQNFCLPFLYYFNIVFLLIEKSRIPLIDNSRMWQHRERYNRNKSSKPSGFYLEKPVNILPNGFVTDVRFILYFRWIHKKMFFPEYSVCRCLIHFKIGTNIFLKTTD